jgi:hypothetical protein
MPSSPDFTVESHGSIFLLQPQNEQAVDRVKAHIGQGNGFQPYSPTILAEHRYIGDIVAGIRNDGWVVSA